MLGITGGNLNLTLIATMNIWMMLLVNTIESCSIVKVEIIVWIPWDEIIVTPDDMVDPSSSLNPFNYLGQSPCRREYDITSSASNVVYTIN